MGDDLRRTLRGDRCVQPASVFDPLSGRAAAELGYEVAFLAGSVASLAVLGAPDMNLLSLSEFAGLARRICRAGSPPLLVDADHGFGNALNVRRTVEELVNAGVAGMTLEDTLLPQPFGPANGMISIAEGALKLQAALDARGDSGFVVIARTSAYMLEGLDAACERARTYAALGVDGLFIAGVKKLSELRAIAEAAGDVPLLVYGVDEVTAEADLASLGVRLLVINHAPFMNAAAAAHATLAAQRGLNVSDTPGDLVARLSQAAAYRDAAKLYLTPESQG